MKSFREVPYTLHCFFFAVRKEAIPNWYLQVNTRGPSVRRAGSSGRIFSGNRSTTSLCIHVFLYAVFTFSLAGI